MDHDEVGGSNESRQGDCHLPEQVARRRHDDNPRGSRTTATPTATDGCAVVYHAGTRRHFSDINVLSRQFMHITAAFGCRLDCGGRLPTSWLVQHNVGLRAPTTLLSRACRRSTRMSESGWITRSDRPPAERAGTESPRIGAHHNVVDPHSPMASHYCGTKCRRQH
jgi:hypothetical protein